VVISLSGRVPKRVSGSSQSRVDDGGSLQYVFWKRVWALRVFSSRRIYRWKGDARGWPVPPYGADALWPPSVSALDSVSCREK
jgi:hypothetical protein